MQGLSTSSCSCAPLQPRLGRASEKQQAQEEQVRAGEGQGVVRRQEDVWVKQWRRPCLVANRLVVGRQEGVGEIMEKASSCSQSVKMSVPARISSVQSATVQLTR